MNELSRFPLEHYAIAISIKVKSQCRKYPTAIAIGYKRLQHPENPLYALLSPSNAARSSRC
ncbi:MAG: hypothetical protein ACK58Z_06010, partial [Pseudanabaena sp.]